ncbi:DUF6233 domain-containing protein [Streptomyces phaeochromogenes]|uniref:DUF6233 domain-containing protein n=1 Tax=Streptomyces phaeochromogenes TaxID=1923 RepID=UPI0027D78E48|nr:DUF6233 domain-containing protein [Streptomyces phaeochromogenes]
MNAFPSPSQLWPGPGREPKQMLAIGRALMAGPRISVPVEPSMSLSPRGSWHRHGEKAGSRRAEPPHGSVTAPRCGRSIRACAASSLDRASRPASTSNSSLPVEVHVGGCYAAAKQRRPVGRDEARRLRASGARACSQGQPDTALGTSATLRSL